MNNSAMPGASSANSLQVIIVADATPLALRGDRCSDIDHGARSIQE
jgi:hypothetical protein